MTLEEWLHLGSTWRGGWIVLAEARWLEGVYFVAVRGRSGCAVEWDGPGRGFARGGSVDLRSFGDEGKAKVWAWARGRARARLKSKRDPSSRKALLWMMAKGVLFVMR